MKSTMPLELTVYHDVLCAWSWIADQRLRLLREEFDPPLRIRYVPFCVRPEDRVPTEWERMAEASSWRKVAREREGKGIVADLWRSQDPPRSSMPPLIALEAASVVAGHAGADRLLLQMRTAAFFHGINITREDVLLELAEKAGLDVHRFSNAFGSDLTRKIVEDQQEEATNRGIDSVPSVVIEGDWLIAGTRSIEEYRSTIRRYVQQQGLWIPERIVH